MGKEGKCKEMMMMLWVMFSLALLLQVTTFPGCSAAANQELKKETKPFGVPSSPNSIGSSLVFHVIGDVFPTGYYYAEIKIGNPGKSYYLDIDTGSDLSWVECDLQVPHQPLYRPNNNSFVVCSNPLCPSIPSIGRYKCDNPTDKCQYKIKYADEATSEGYLVNDIFPLHFTNGSLLGVPMAFGCGYDQSGPVETNSPTNGVLGLGTGKVSIVTQLSSLGLKRNVIGHCFSSRGGGYLFLGEDLVPSTGIVWSPMSHNPTTESHYSPGQAEIILGKQSIGVKRIYAVFDSGSSYTYFNSRAYNAFISSLMKDLTGKPLKIVKDETLPICWGGPKPFKSLIEAKKYFKPVILSFTNSRNTQMEIHPESYLILSENGNFCLGILNGAEVDLTEFNLIGDLFFQDKVVIYNNEKQQIGWAAADCNKPPKSGIVLL